MPSLSTPAGLPDVSLERVFRIQRAFFDNRWLGSSTGEAVSESALNASCWIASQLDDDQFNLFADLLARFTRVDISHYEPALSAALEAVPTTTNSKIRYFAVPLISPKDVGKAKSSTALPYIFKHAIWPKSEKFKNSSLEMGMSPEMLINSRPSKDPFVTFVLDDFIGTGDTACEFLDDYNERFKSDHETLVFLSIATMKTGLQRVKDRQIDIYYHKLIEKGIGDSLTITDKERAYDLIDQIEQMLSINSDYYRGYKSSEALISLLNTPNNTFPMFWAKKAKAGDVWRAPFPRR